MDNNIELLAPAGEWDSFVAAVENGADAVYMGGKLFNARQFAGNFDNEQLKKALDYAHVRDVKIYLTMNTLLTSAELGQALDFAQTAYLMGVDGIIVQDIGFAKLLRECYPGFELHASTQMTVYNLEGVKILEELGFKRAVLARELTLAEIEYISKNTPLEVEVFIHGALCISYSGQCLMSSIIGGRSGNRGKCAQPCRLPYQLVEAELEEQVKARRKSTSPGGKHGIQEFYSGAAPANNYLLSPKDLCSLDELQGLINAGVKSFKIEGRMKSPEYVATVVRIYRKYIHKILESGAGKVDRQDMKELAQVFNRGGFSKGYLTGKTGRDMMCYEKPKNWGIYLGDVLSYDKAARTVRLKLHENVSVGDGVEVWTGENESPGTVVSGIKVNGKSLESAGIKEVADIGNLTGRILKGSKVYKTSDKALNNAARESFSKGLRKAGIYGKVSVKSSEPVMLTIYDNKQNIVTVRGETLPERAINRPLTRERLIEQLEKTGATPFEFIELSVEVEENLSLPVSEINNLRRKALEELETKRVQVPSRSISTEKERVKDELVNLGRNRGKQVKNPGISALFYSLPDNMEMEGLEIDRIYLPFAALLDDKPGDVIRLCKKYGIETFVWLQPVTRGRYGQLVKSRLKELVDSGIDGVLAGNLGSLEYVRNFTQLELAGDYSLNAFNDFALKQLAELGFHSAALSLELNLAQISSLKECEHLKKEAVVYGRIPVMTSEYCPVGSISGGFGKNSACNTSCKKGTYKLKDRMGMEFPVLCDRIDCRSTILNANVLFMPESMDKLKNSGIDMARLNFTDEGTGEIKDIIKMHRDLIEDSAAIGKYSALIERIKGKGFTKGHYFRGV